MWYVIWTVTGGEEALAGRIRSRLPSRLCRECFCMKRESMKKLGGEWVELTEPLFPGYVFLDTGNPEEAFYSLKRLPGFAVLLGGGQGGFIPLEREEEAFLAALCGQAPGYLVKKTRVYLDPGGKIRGFKGPLELFKDRIREVNLRKRYAVLDIPLRGKEKTALFGIRLEKDG